MQNNAISVKQLNTYVKGIIESDARLSFITVTGEISNFKNHYASGHWYFTLKDSEASVRCVMFKAAASRVSFMPQDGVLVTLRGRVSLYEKDGQYQFYAEQMQKAGDGDLALKFRLIKEKLEAEGLFDTESKRALAKYPRRIAVITSDTGAAIQDILNITAKRYPLCEIVMCPVNVQGVSAAKDMIDTLERVYALEGIDTIIIGRGGGSVEDLDTFNDEALARKLYESPIPVISAVGHETDFTICDFVADVRAATPSHAAQLAVPEKAELISLLQNYGSIITRRLKAKCELLSAKLDGVLLKRCFSYPLDLIDRRSQRLDILSDRMADITQRRLADFEKDFVKNLSALDAISPLKTLARGYSIAQKQGRTVKSVGDIATGDNMTLTFFDGKAECKITATAERKK